MKRLHTIFLFFLFLFSCSDDETPLPSIEEENKITISAVDLSALPEIEKEETVFYNSNGEAEDMLTTLQNNGVNTIRLKLWHQPTNEHASFGEVTAFAERIHSMGMKVWLTVHYSDTWADPSRQELPTAWAGLSYEVLKDSLTAYTTKIISDIQPDFIQIGNEINNGFLFPHASINTNEQQLKGLLAAATVAIRNASPNVKIMLHYAGLNGAISFFDKMKTIDYDVIGLSYYPLWHGKELNVLETTITALNQQFNKEILIAETAYPFTLDWNDWTNNIIGLEEQLILPDYPATPEGQKDFLLAIKNITERSNILGFCYWGGELVAFKGNEATNGSSWENQALYDFENKVLPVIEVFR